MNRTRRILTAAILAASGSLLLAGCATQTGASPVGTWGVDEGPQLVLEDGGQLSGTDGCNSLAGTWKHDGDAVAFGEVAMTLMACEGVDTWLSGLSTGEVDGDTLRIRDAGDIEIGSLERQ